MDTKIYYASPFTWMISIPFILFTAFFVLFAIYITPSIFSLDNIFIMLILFLAVLFPILFTGYIALLFFDIPMIRLELSEEGMILYSNGYRIYTPWENIIGYAWLRSSRTFPDIIQLQEPAVVGEISFEEGIASRRAVSEKRRWWISNRQLKVKGQYPDYIRLPVVLLRRKDKQDGSINQYLQYYLPHLVENP